MSTRLDGVLDFCAHHRYTFPMIAKLGQDGLKAARATGIFVVWRRVPITTVTIALVIGSWLYDYVSISSAADFTTLRSTAVEYVPPIPFKPLPVSRSSDKRTETGRAQDAKAALSAFRRKRVGKNEVDYIAEDVTIRLFTPSPIPTQVPQLNKQLRIGQDVTVSYFEYKPALLPQTRPDSSASQPVERSLLVSK